jgi:hypothetical protein
VNRANQLQGPVNLPCLELQEVEVVRAKLGRQRTNKKKLLASKMKGTSVD